MKHPVMNKVLCMFAGILLLIIILASLGIALASSMSSLTSSAAQLATSTALLTNQCLTGFLVSVV